MLEEIAFPFKRQNYYKGKQLTAQKCIDEQNYMNWKRSLISTYLQGYGVVCGLNVEQNGVSNLNLYNGWAIDAMGREVIAEENKVYNVAQIKGYQETLENELYLGISYRETLTDEVYAPMCRENEKSQMMWDEIEEGYELFLTPTSEVEQVKPFVENYIGETLIYNNGSISVKQFTPLFASCYEGLRIKIEVTNESAVERKCSLGYDLDLKDFRTRSGERYLQIALEQIRLKAGEKLIRSYEVFPEGFKQGKMQMKISKGSFYIYENCVRETPLKKDFYFELQVSMKGVWDLINETYLKKGLNEKQSERQKAKIWLAAISITRAGNIPTIKELISMPFKQYFYTQNLFYLSAQLQTYYPALTERSGARKSYREEPTRRYPKYETDDGFATGILVVPGDLAVGEVYLTEWVPHGLGEGCVYVEAGIDFAQEDGGQSSCISILGEGGLFTTSPQEQLKWKHAIKINHDQATFQVAVQLLSGGISENIRLRWYAVKMF